MGERCWGLDLWPPPDREEVMKSVYHADLLPLTFLSPGRTCVGVDGLARDRCQRTRAVGSLSVVVVRGFKKKRGEPSLRIKRRVSHLDGLAVHAFAQDETWRVNVVRQTAWVAVTNRTI